MPIGFLQAVEMPIVASNGLLQDVRGDEVLAVVRSGARRRRPRRAGHAQVTGRAQRGARPSAASELRMGIGINSGTVALGLVGGVNRMALTVIGDAVEPGVAGGEHEQAVRHPAC